MFGDIDLVFFGGILHGNVAIGWLSQREFLGIGAPGEVFGGTRNSRSVPGQAVIRLNASLILFFGFQGQDLSFEHLWQTLLHEMIVGTAVFSRSALLISKSLKNCLQHAYSKVRCFVWPNADPGHGPRFQAALRAINRRSIHLVALTIDMDWIYV